MTLRIPAHSVALLKFYKDEIVHVKDRVDCAEGRDSAQVLALQAVGHVTGSHLIDLSASP